MILATWAVTPHILGSLFVQMMIPLPIIGRSKIRRHALHRNDPKGDSFDAGKRRERSQHEEESPRSRACCWGAIGELLLERDLVGLGFIEMLYTCDTSQTPAVRHTLQVHEISVWGPKNQTLVSCALQDLSDYI